MLRQFQRRLLCVKIDLLFGPRCEQSLFDGWRGLDTHFVLRAGTEYSGCICASPFIAPATHEDSWRRHPPGA